MQVLIHHLSGRASERRLARYHLPEHNAQRVEVRADVHANTGELLWTSELGSTSKNSRRRNNGFSRHGGCELCQPEVNNLYHRTASFLEAHHDIARLDVPVYQLLLVHRSQAGGDLCCNFQGQLHFDPPRAFDEMFKRLSFHELHRVEVTVPSSAQV